jgi:hypothetical protein
MQHNPNTLIFIQANLNEMVAGSKCASMTVCALSGTVQFWMPNNDSGKRFKMRR